MSELDFGVLGELVVAVDGRHVDVGPRLQRNLLGILLVEAGRVVPVDRLVDLLWGDDPPAAATASLQAYVSQLRRVLEPDRPARAPARVLITQDPGYALRVDADQVDAWRFDTLAATAHELLRSGRPEEALERLDDGLRLWRGEPLVEFAAEPWAVPVIGRLAETRDVALEDRVDAWLALGRHVQAASELEEMVEARPLREHRWAQLILATYRCARQADALRAYQRCRAVLGEGLGIEPGPELRRLEAAVLAHDPELEWAAPVRSATTQEQPAPRSPQPVEARPLVVARAVQIDRISERVAEASHGRGGAVILVGEPGVGKTTLAEQAADIAADRGALVVWSRCIGPDAAPAYWPWIQLLRSLPEGSRVTAARHRLEGEDEIREQGAAAAFHAYEAVLDALREASTQRAVVACIDDLHAADEASLDLVQLIAGDLSRMPLLVVVTLRDTEPSTALDRTLGGLLRHRGVERLMVPPLQSSDVERLAERSIGATPSPQVVDALLERTGGNLFYLIELLRLLGPSVSADAVLRLDVPSGIRDVVMQRVRRLPDNTQALLTVAAVVGRDADLELLERAAHLDTEQLMLALEPAVAAGLLVPVDPGWGYRFRHPLIQESIQAATGQVERARLHARVAAAIEGLNAPDTPGRRAQLAHHYLAAGRLGDLPKAVAYARAAAAAAIRQGAWADAIRHLEHALASGAATGGARCDVLVELARARRAAGLIAESHAALEEAIEIADAAGDNDRVLNAAVAFGSVALWGSRAWGEVDTHLVGILERQLHRLTDSDDPRRVGICATLAAELYFGADAALGWEYANQAMALARRLGDPQLLGIAVSGYLLSSLVNERVAERTRTIAELLGKPELGLGPDVDAVLRTNLLTERLRSGDMAAFDADLARARELATDVLHSVELEAQLWFAEACREILAGDVAAARQAGERGFSQLRSVSATWTEPAWLIMETSLMLVAGVTGAPAPTLGSSAEELLAMADSPHHPSVPHIAVPAAALGYLARDDDAMALDLARRRFAPPPTAWTWMQPIAYWAQVAARLGEPDPAWLYQQLLPHSGELAIVGIGADCGGAVDSLLAGLALRTGHSGDALRHALDGLALERHAGARAWIARTTQLIDRARAAGA